MKNNEVKMVKYEALGEDKMILTFTDGSELIVWKKDFNRAFMVFLNCTKAELERDYGIK